MNEAAQIRRCSGAIRSNHLRFRPSLLQPPPARRPTPNISNREPLRLETRLTQRKQTIRERSNRENNTCFSSRVRAVNRLCDCRAIDSARRYIARPARRPNLIISNREPLRLEIDVTHRKQTTDHHPNRENNACFQVTARTCRGGPSVPFTVSPPGLLPRAKPRGRPSVRPSSHSPLPASRLQLQTPDLQPPKRAKRINRHPPKVFRLEKASIVYFL
jgi:hypothetical protein